MRLLIQRVAEAAVEIDGMAAARIGRGLVIFFCAMRGDTAETIPALARKVSKLRILQDHAGKMNLSLVTAGGAALVVSQFTLAADTSRGNRPGFSGAADPAAGKHLYEIFVTELANHCPVQTGVFGAEMQVRLTNDGPVTIWLDT